MRLYLFCGTVQVRRTKNFDLCQIICFGELQMPKKSFKETEKGHEGDWLEQTIACSSEKFNRIQGDNMTPRDRSINYLFIYFLRSLKTTNGAPNMRTVQVNYF